jgi:hypothetical protein
MEYRQLGRSGLRISRLTLGTMSFGGKGQFRNVGEVDLEGARRQITMAMDAGVNVIDPTSTRTAPPRRSSARPSRAGATRCCWRRRLGLRWGPVRTTRDSRATI